MKKLILLLLLLSCLFSSNTSNAQISYNGVILNTDESLLKDESVTLRIKIRQNVPEGSSVFEEEHTTTTNKYGIFYISIGEGNGSGDFNAINWGKAEYYVETALKTNADNYFRVLGVTKLAYAPLALYAKNAGAGVFKTENGVTSNANGNIGADNFVFGSRQLDDSGNAADDNRMFFDKRKGAFRAGQTISTQWNSENVGISSTALGFNTTASGDYSTALGRATASGIISTAMGNTTARSGYETTIGRWNTDYTPNDITGWDWEDRLFVIGNGFSSASRSDALIVYKDGDATLKGQLTLSNGSSSYTLPNSDGVDGQVITTDGKGNAIWQTLLAGPFTNNNNIINGGDDNDDFVFGSSQLDDSGNVKEDNRMFFDKSKGAFRAGKTTTTYWDVSNVGTNSAALGFNTIASGDISTAIGSLTTASGRSSTAMGNNTTAKSGFEITVGRYNTDYNPNDVNGWNAADRLFVIGNGSISTTKSDALVMLKNGNTELNGTFTIDASNDNTGYTLPISKGTENQVLTANADGTTGWKDISGTKGDKGDKGDQGDDGKSAYQIWLDAGNTGTESDFLESLKGAKGDIGEEGLEGKSAYQIWIDAGNTGTESDFLESLKGAKGDKGNDGSFQVNSGVVSNANGNIATDDFVFGSTQLDDVDGTSNDNSRMFFNKSKAAFRVGVVNGTQWDDTNVGYSSIAFGSKTKASGDYSTAIGDETKAIGPGSIAMGNRTTASGYGSISMGVNTTASSGYETTIGSYNTEYTPADTEGFNQTDRLFVIGNGISTTNKSDALVMLKNGNTELNGTFTIDASNDDTGYTLPTAKGTENQVLTANADGTTSWKDASGGGVFQKNNQVVTNVTSNTNTDEDFVFGSTQLDDDTSTTNDNNRFFFDKSKGAFRSGKSSSDSWDESKIGNNSFATGRGTQASGGESFASGRFTIASGTGSTALGSSTKATGFYSTVSGLNSIAEGDYSFAIGSGAKSNGDYSIAMGSSVTANSLFQTTIGSLNTDRQDNNTNLDLNPIFVIGNGKDGNNKSDAVVVLKSGNTEINGALTIDVANDDTGYTLPTQKGTENQVLTANADGTTSWKDASGGSNDTTYEIGFNANLGGYVAYVTPNGKHGIVVSMVDQSPSSGNQTTTWGEAFNRISIPNYFDTDGQNFTDWRLPTSYELANYILENASILNIVSEDYWTNSESLSVSKAVVLNTSRTITIQGKVSFLPFDKNKQTLAKVRAVRSF